MPRHTTDCEKPQRYPCWKPGELALALRLNTRPITIQRSASVNSRTSHHECAWGSTAVATLCDEMRYAGGPGEGNGRRAVLHAHEALGYMGLSVAGCRCAFDRLALTLLAAL